jgi:hypothetical protein
VNHCLPLLQNKHRELFNLLHWANPGLVTDWREFSAYYITPLKLGQKRDASDYMLAMVRCPLALEKVKRNNPLTLGRLTTTACACRQQQNVLGMQHSSAEGTVSSSFPLPQTLLPLGHLTIAACACRQQQSAHFSCSSHLTEEYFTTSSASQCGDMPGMGV